LCVPRRQVAVQFHPDLVLLYPFLLVRSLCLSPGHLSRQKTDVLTISADIATKEAMMYLFIFPAYPW
jgi:hypothetical protein